MKLQQVGQEPLTQAKQELNTKQNEKLSPRSPKSAEIMIINSFENEWKRKHQEKGTNHAPYCFKLYLKYNPVP